MFDETGKARNGDPDTSHEAAASIDATALEALVLDAITSTGRYGAAQDDLLRIMSGWEVQTITPRIHPLLTKGMVFDLGERRVGHSNRRQRVVVARPFLEEWEIAGYGWSPTPSRKALLQVIRDLLDGEEGARESALAIVGRSR